MNKIALKREYKTMLRDLDCKLAHFFSLCPNMPEDEYNIEAQWIMARLDKANSPQHLADIIREVFTYWFNDEFVASFSGYDEVAAWLWEASRKCGIR